MRCTLVLVSLLAACDDGGGAGSECGKRADCAEGYECAGPNDPPVCGIAPRQQCALDGDCGVGRCHAIDDSCSPDGIGSECRPPCAMDADCGASFRCDNGACVAVSCDAGFACAAREVCDPSRITNATPIYNRHHGCFAVSCASDAECGERSCVNGTCQDGPGACRQPMLVP